MSKIVLFGDSILAGYRLDHISPVITNAIQNAFPKDQIINNSFPGATTDHAIEKVNQQVLAKKPDIVILNFGVNDARVNFGMSAGRFNSNLATLVEKIGAHKIIIIAPSYTNWRATVDQSWPRILQFELVTEHISQEYNLPFLDLAKLMQKDGAANSYLQEDGLHLNEAGNKLLISHLIPLIKNLKEKNSL